VLIAKGGIGGLGNIALQVQHQPRPAPEHAGQEGESAS
jgi:GTPase involved in cell partitioning and DNA repair